MRRLNARVKARYPFGASQLLPEVLYADLFMWVLLRFSLEGLGIGGTVGDVVSAPALWLRYSAMVADAVGADCGEAHRRRAGCCSVVR